MRLHSLTVQAFGPFPGREHIDFDALEHGILLINGPTGSGKSSLLDAIAFALFGDVPGARKSLRHSLRSHHAEPLAEPRVELEFSVGSTRWRIERSPQWEAPKRRGTGTTTRQASVLLSQWRDGTWHLVSQRIDEAAEMMTDTLGMRLEQFAQVVLLPQGEFAQFLRARPEERRVLLERLFDVSRFEAIEAWFTETKNQRARESQAARERIGGHLAILDDALTRLDVDLAAPEIDDVASVPEHLRDVVREVAQRREAFDDDAEDAEQHARSAERAVEDEQERSRLRSRAHEAVEVLEEWPSERLASVRRTLDDAASVAGALRLARRAETADADARRARAAADAAAAAVREVGVDLVDGVWPPPHLEADDLDELAERLRALAARAAEVDSAESRRARLSERDDTARARLTDTESALERASAEAQEATVAHDEAVLRAEAMPDSAAARAAYERVLDLAARRPGHVASLEHARTAALGATRAHAEAERHVLRLREARLAGIAGELGASLQPEQPCPVCGSCEHPAPAEPGPDAPGPEAIEQAESRASQTDAARLEAASASSAAEERLAQLDGSIGAAHDELRGTFDALIAGLGQPDATSDVTMPLVLEDPSSVARHLADADPVATWAGVAPTVAEVVDHDAASAAPAQDVAALLDGVDAEQARLAQDVARLRRRLEQADAACSQATSAHSAAREGLTHAEDALAEATSTLEAATAARAETQARVPSLTLKALGIPWAGADEAPTDAAAIERTLTSVRDRRRLLDEFARRRQDAERAAAAADDAAQAVADELAAAGHATIDDARALALPDDERARLDDEWNDAVRRRAGAQATLDDEAVRIAVLTPAADLEQLRTRADVLARRARDATATAVRWRQAHAVVDSVRHQLADAVRAYLPLARRAAETAELAASFTGTGENDRRMRLTSYVLAAHLESVTRMANERLATMTDGRYQLRYTDERARGNQRSGLGLLVVDAWTGRSRDTATLSGGEAFMASLALALGLGDAVRADSGGLELHTLFVDEGFGSLDQDTLEQVMEVLDSLREGGRLVGVVSHVTELRARIPTHVEVIKTSEGSRVRTTSHVPNAVSATA